MNDFRTVEDLFKDLDAREFNFFASALAAYRKALVNEGFNNRESMRLVEAYAKFIYNMGLEEFIAEKTKEADREFFDDDFDEDDDE